MRPVPPAISDRALVSFLQRSGLDVERVRDQLARGLAQAHGAAMALGGGDHQVAVEGFSFIVRNGVVVTCTQASTLGARAAQFEPR